MSKSVCPECGARLAPGAERCDLCGASVETASEESVSGADVGPEPGAADASDPIAPSGKPVGGVYCHQCGWKNPPDARFCSQCGTRLQARESAGSPDVSSSAASSKDRPAASQAQTSADAPSAAKEASESGLSRYVGVLIGLSVLIVVALYMITIVSKQNVGNDQNAAGVAEAPADVRSAAVIEEHESIPIDTRFAATVDSFQTAIEEAAGESRDGVQREFVDYLVSIGRVDRAAIQQQRLARRTNQAADWRLAGDLLYDWMEAVSDRRKTDVALLAIDAYERVLDENPDNLDVRADLGWVYQFDPRNPMEAIRQTNMVLEAEPDHLAANYNRGVFLLRINRLDDAIEQFEKVKELAPSESAYYRQADMWIETVGRQ